MPTLPSLLPALSDDSVLARALSTLGSGSDVTLAVGSIVRPVVAAAAFHSHPRPTLVIVPGDDAAERFARQVRAYLEHDQVEVFPSRADMPWERTAHDVTVVGKRARALYALDHGREVMVVASARSLLRALPPEGSHVFTPLVLEAGGTLDLTEVAAQLERMGYERSDQADQPGLFAVHGGTLDVFASDAVNPVRAELFGDEVESLRRFVPSTGQSIGDSPGVEVFACREVRLGSRAAQAAARAFPKAANEEIVEDLERITEGVYFNGVERYLPVFYRKTGTVLDFLSAEALVLLVEPRAIFDDMSRGYDEIVARAHTASVKPDGLFIPPSGIDLGSRQRLMFLSVLRAGGAVDGEIASRRPDVAGGEDAFIGGVRGLLSAGMRVLVTVADRRSSERIERTLVDAGISVRQASAGMEPDNQVVTIVQMDVPAGFVLPGASLAVVSTDDAFPRSAKRAAADPTKLTFAFNPGDFVVHTTHGIALFKEIVRQEVLGAERDYLLLEYAKGDKLYVPVEQLDRITKFVGAEGGAPRLTRLDTADWTKVTRKARKAAHTLAFDIVDLYARRAAVSGFTFSPDTPWQDEMEAGFPFEETPDQLAAIADVKADMESDKPMDRLVCGDVGYGKTEVAIRAVFKATQDHKQVMVLCPTTILAQQHFTNFSERFESFPVQVEVLSRFRTKAQQTAALEGFAKGTVDVLIGTHRLLSADVTPRNLGLVVIDEEQRFGVEHKEHLKNLREQIDVLTLTATPIPRTLQMALSGVRDMSTIDTPPPNRFPVNVHVGEYDHDIVSNAIRREIERGGQVYYISNRVHSIDEAVRRVREAAPEARIAVGHGQLSEHQLERIMERFVAGEVDVLVATTIVESGIDNPHTNTLIIEDSQRLGLAQLYQLKGRVGRSHLKAYAYFLFPRGQQLTEQAYERLVAVRENTELGSGIKIAMRDLEIRGAGSMLGADQSGNLSAVGFDLYAQMLREAVSEVRGEPPVAHPEIHVDIPVAAFLPAEYIPAVDARVLFYRRFAGAITPDAVEAVASQLMAAFGPPPIEAAALMDVARVRALTAELGATAVNLSRHRLTVQPVVLDREQRGRVSAAGGLTGVGNKVAFSPLHGEAPTQTALRALGVILSAIRDISM